MPGAEALGIESEQIVEHLEERLQLFFALLIVFEEEMHLGQVEEQSGEKGFKLDIFEVGEFAQFTHSGDNALESVDMALFGDKTAGGVAGGYRIAQRLEIGALLIEFFQVYREIYHVFGLFYRVLIFRGCV